MVERVKDELLSPSGETVMKAADYFLDKGRKEGLIEGRLEGHMEGRTEGRIEGIQEGKIQGQVNVLQKLIHLKFGTASHLYENKIKQAVASEIDAWVERILYVKSLNELFDEELVV